MAIEKTDYRVDTYDGPKVTPVPYWAYGGFDRMVTIAVNPDNPAGPKEHGVVVKLLGYTSAEARAAAKLNGFAPDHSFEFLIHNWTEILREYRPATVEEKQAANLELKLTPEQWEEMKMDVVTKEEHIPHNDYDRLRPVLGLPEEVKVAYEILKTSVHSKDFMAGAVDLL